MTLSTVLLTSLAVAAPAREPAVAGSFYPAEAKALQATVDGFLAKAKTPPDHHSGACRHMRGRSSK